LLCNSTESWLTGVVPNSLICPPGYVAFRRDRETSGGGVAIFLKDIISAVTIDIPVQFNHIEVVCVDLFFSGVVCRVICFYRSPGFSDTDVSYMIDLVKCLQKLCSILRS